MNHFYHNGPIVELNNESPKKTINTIGKILVLYKIWSTDSMNLSLNHSLTIKIINQDNNQLLKTSLLAFMKDQGVTSYVDIMKKIENENEVTIEIENNPYSDKNFDLRLEYQLI